MVVSVRAARNFTKLHEYVERSKRGATSSVIGSRCVLPPFHVLRLTKYFRANSTLTWSREQISDINICYADVVMQIVGNLRV
jgi:hypothetical protein